MENFCTLREAFQPVGNFAGNPYLLGNVILIFLTVHIRFGVTLQNSKQKISRDKKIKQKKIYKTPEDVKSETGTRAYAFTN